MHIPKVFIPQIKQDMSARYLVTLEGYSKSNRGKKYTANIQDVQTGRRAAVSFGARGYEDYTMHKDPVRKERYIARHQARENWSDPFTAGFWSRWLLWNCPSIEASKRWIEKHTNIRFV